MFKVIGEQVLVKDIESTEAGLIDHAAHLTRISRRGIVCDAGKCPGIENGDHVLFEYCAGFDLTIGDDEYILLNPSTLLAVIETCPSI